MSRAMLQELSQALQQIDRPGSFCVGGSAPVVLPGLEVTGLGPVGLPLTARQADELKQLCEQAPYGKGEETLVDTSVRRVWRLKPEQFSLTNPDWQKSLRQTVRQIQEELGLGKQKLEAHLYELLLYEKGSFFLPHRDGEKLDRMVATLAVVLPSSFEGGELVVRHEGQERTFDFGSGDDTQFRIHYAAFYADCEHEIRPLREGHRLCLVYNLTLTKGKKGVAAPRSSEHVERISGILREWAEEAGPPKLVVTLEHQYTQEGLAWDALKGVDRARAQALAEAARQAGCHAYLALLTFHESGSAVDDGYYYGRRRRWDDYEEERSGPYEMDEVYETSLSADHWSDSQGNRLPFGVIPVDEGELLDPEALTDVDPEEEFEGYTGNAGMTLDRWYRHGAVVLWPDKRHFEVLCGAGSEQAIESLKLLVDQWRHAGKETAADLHAQCVALASAIIATWRENPYGRQYYGAEPAPSPLLPLLARLDDPALVKAYLAQVLTRDASVEPGKALTEVCRKHGWDIFRPELEVVFQNTTAATIERNVQLLEQLCLAKPHEKEAWIELCRVLAQAALQALEAIDQQAAAHDWQVHRVNRAKLLAGLARALLATEQDELLERLVAHALARPQTYPPTEVHVAALTELQPWLAKHVKRPSRALSRWITACGEQLEALTEEEPRAPADFRRGAPFAPHGPDQAALKRFLEDPHEQVFRYRANEPQRASMEHLIRQHGCDLDVKTERQGRPYTLVCTKNTASYQARLHKYGQDQEHLARLRAIQASLPK
jgi:hypothetical protein